MKEHRFITVKLVSIVILLLNTTFLLANEKDKPTIAVFDFGFAENIIEKVSITSSEGNSSTIKKEYETSLLRDKFITLLTQSRNVTVIEREKLAQIIKEVELTQAEMTDPKHSIKLGKLLGADYLLFGTISMMEDDIENRTLPYNAGVLTLMKFTVGANIRITKTATGEIIAAESTRVKNEEKTLGTFSSIPAEFKQETYDKLVEKLVKTVNAQLFPLLVAMYKDDVVYLNQGGKETHTRQIVIKPGEDIIDPVSGRILGTTETEIAIIEVTEGLANMSKARVVEWLSEETNIPAGAVCRQIK